MGALHPFRRGKGPRSGAFSVWNSPSIHGVSFAVQGLGFRFPERALYMVTLHPYFRPTLVRVFRMNNDSIDAAAGSADNSPPHHTVVPIETFNSEARNLFHLMLDANKDTTHEQVSL